MAPCILFDCSLAVLADKLSRTRRAVLCSDSKNATDYETALRSTFGPNTEVCITKCNLDQILPNCPLTTIFYDAISQPGYALDFVLDIRERDNAPTKALIFVLAADTCNGARFLGSKRRGADAVIQVPRRRRVEILSLALGRLLKSMKRTYADPPSMRTPRRPVTLLTTEPRRPRRISEEDLRKGGALFHAGEGRNEEECQLMTSCTMARYMHSGALNLNVRPFATYDSGGHPSFQHSPHLRRKKFGATILTDRSGVGENRELQSRTSRHHCVRTASVIPCDSGRRLELTLPSGGTCMTANLCHILSRDSDSPHAAFDQTEEPPEIRV